MSGLRAVVLGGSSFSTPALFAALAMAPVAEAEFVLVGRSAARLEAVARASRLVGGAQSPRITTHVADPETSAAALAGADVVVLQMRIGGFEGRDFDESFPLEFGLCGDEGLGVGGLSAALRAWPVIERWIAAIERHAPRALVLMVSSPVGILVSAVARRFPALNCLGICEVPLVQLRDICAALATDLDAVSFDYVGVNHIGWLYGVTTGERDLAAEWARLPRPGFPSGDLIADWGAVPTKYQRLHFEPDAVLAGQRAVPESRSAALVRLQDDAHATYVDGDVAAIRASLARRFTPWYPDAVAPLLSALYGSPGAAQGLFFLSGRNAGSVAGFADDDVLEFAYTVRDRELTRLPTRRPAGPRLVEHVGSFCRYERLATDAVLDPSIDSLQTALRAHPWVEPLARADAGRVALLARTIAAGWEPAASAAGAA